MRQQVERKLALQIKNFLQKPEAREVAWLSKKPHLLFGQPQRPDQTLSTRSLSNQRVTAGK